MNWGWWNIGWRAMRDNAAPLPSKEEESMTVESRRIALFAALFAPSSMWAAAGPQNIAFEVAAIKIGVMPEPQPMLCLTPCMPGERLTVDHSRVDIRYMSLQRLIVIAYRIKPYQLSGPDWMRSQRFDILATMPAGASKDQIPEMLQALLAERFQLAIHRETKELPVFALVIGRNGTKLKEAAPDAAPAPPTANSSSVYTPQGDVRLERNGNGSSTAIGTAYGTVRTQMGPDGATIDLSKVSMPALAELLAPHVSRPVIDMTNLNGNYRVVIEMPPPSAGGGGGRKSVRGGTGADSDSPEPSQSPSDPMGEPFVRSIEKLGLKLDPRKAPVDTIVVDRLEKTPTAN